MFMQHPVTSNLASMKNYEWLTHTKSFGTAQKKTFSNNGSEIKRNMNHFLNFMLQNGSHDRLLLSRYYYGHPELDWFKSILIIGLVVPVLDGYRE